MQYHLAIIEDNIDLRESYQDYFCTVKEFSFLVQFDSVESFLNSPSINSIDIILLDLGLQGMSGLDGIPLIKEICPNASILVNTVLDDSETVFLALKYGATGYITKGISLENIKYSLLHSINGMSVMSPSIAIKVLNFFKTSNRLTEKLTKKELQIAQSLKDGLSYKLIAYECDISIDGVRYHIRNIYKKLAINSKGELMNLMFRSDLN
jgi:DNA-binding NarL/FixJ family response regulator